MARIPPAYAGVLERHYHEHPKPKINFYRKFPGAASVASFQAAVLTEIYLCNVCSYQEILRRNGRG
eukprot:COSAG01_NODE_7046_length_3377_cov_4.561853_3_plen_66_part_00